MKSMGRTSAYDKLILEALDKRAQCGKKLFDEVKDKMQENGKRMNERSFQEALYRLLNNRKIEITDFAEECDNRKRKQAFTYHAFVFEKRHKNRMEDILQLLNKFTEDQGAAKRLRKIFKAKVREANRAYKEDIKTIKENLILIPQKKLIEEVPPLKKELKKGNILHPFQREKLMNENRIWCLEREVKIRHPFHTTINPKIFLPVSSNFPEEWPIIVCTLEAVPYTDREAKTKKEIIKKMEDEKKIEPHFFIFPIKDERIDEVFEELLLDLLDPESFPSKADFARKLSDITPLNEFIDMMNRWETQRALDELDKEIKEKEINLPPCSFPWNHTYTKR